MNMTGTGLVPVPLSPGTKQQHPSPTACLIMGRLWQRWRTPLAGITTGSEPFLRVGSTLKGPVTSTTRVCDIKGGILIVTYFNNTLKPTVIKENVPFLGM